MLWFGNHPRTSSGTKPASGNSHYEESNTTVSKCRGAETSHAVQDNTQQQRAVGANATVASERYRL